MECKITMVATPKAWKHVFFFAEGQGGIPKSAREQKENNTFSGVHSRRLGGWANLESEKHASKRIGSSAAMNLRCSASPVNSLCAALRTAATPMPQRRLPHAPPDAAMNLRCSGSASTRKTVNE